MVEPVVVLGAGQAGCQVVASLREQGFSGRIVLVGSESHLPYQRPPLSKGYLTGSVQRAGLLLRPEAWYAEQSVELHLGVTATDLDLEDCRLHLSDGQQLGYSQLILALGSRPRLIDIPGVDLDGVVTLRGLDEADDSRRRMASAHAVVVLGGGFIGLEVTATATCLGTPTTMLELAPALMSRVLSRRTADALLDAHRRRGVTVELGTAALSLEGDHGRVAAVRTTDGRRLHADLVLVGVGALPKDSLAETAGLEVGNGIVVDSLLRTSDSRVLAVGDCARAPHPYADGLRVRLESVQNAVSQARTAAATVLGRSEPYNAVPWFWSDQFDLKLQIAGLTDGHDEVVVTGDVARDRFSAWCFRNGELLGVESVNRPAEHLSARRILAVGSGLSADQVRSGCFDPKEHASQLECSARSAASSTARA